MKFLVLTVDRESNGKSPLFLLQKFLVGLLIVFVAFTKKTCEGDILYMCMYIYICIGMYTHVISNKLIIFKYIYIYHIYMYIHLDAIVFQHR